MTNNTQMQAGPTQRPEDHPMFPVVMAAIHQAMFGKGERHGGASVPWLQQPIFHYAKMHGRAFLTGQAAKKLEEAASTRNGEAFVTEVLGAIVYASAAIIREQQIAHEKGHDGIPLARFPEQPWRPGNANLPRPPLGGHDGPGGVITQTIPAASAPWPFPEKGDPAAWARKEEQTRERRVPDHGKVVGGSRHPHKKVVREDCLDCDLAICDECDGRCPSRRRTDISYQAQAPGPDVDDMVFRTGRCTCGSVDGLHHITCGSLSIDMKGSGFRQAG